MTNEEAIKWMEEAILDTKEFFDQCSPALQKELIEQKEVFELAVSAIRATPAHITQSGWISVKDRLPEDEARQYIEDDLDGIGYLYPCLLTYKSPNTERIHVVRFYYDIIQKWFVNNGEELCEKGRCIAWMPLPAPYDRRPPEGDEDA